MIEYPATRAKAKELGFKHYYTGKPCSHGHIDKRETGNGSCTECRRITTEADKEKRAAYFDAYNKSDKGQANKKRYYADNREIVIAKARARPEHVIETYRKKWGEKNPEMLKAYVNTRRRRYKEATPKWQTAADIRKIKDFHLAAIEMTRLTGIKHEVDHKIPIQGDLVCGLHTPDNLQIITKAENVAKNNKYEIE
jgi:hypothetical protein